MPCLLLPEVLDLPETSCFQLDLVSAIFMGNRMRFGATVSGLMCPTFWDIELEVPIIS